MERAYVVLITPTALKVDGVRPWVHHSHVRRASTEEKEQFRKDWKATVNPDDPKN